MGQVRSVDRDIVYSDGKVYHYDGKLMKLTKSYDGYNYVTFCKNQFEQKFAVHRLVALAFIPNPNNLPQVNHLDCIRDDNRMSNLEWCTGQENTLYAMQQGHIPSKDKHPNAKLTGLYIDDILISYYTCLEFLGEAICYSKGNLSKFINSELLVHDVFKLKNIIHINANCPKNKTLNFNTFNGVFSPLKVTDLNNNILGIYNNTKECNKYNPKFNWDTIGKAKRNGAIYKKEYRIYPITRYEYLTANINLINKKI